MVEIIDHNLPGDAVRLLGGGKEVYRWTKQDDALARTHAEHKEARRPGKRKPGKASIIKEDLDLWKETVILGDQLVSELREVARAPFMRLPFRAS